MISLEFLAIFSSHCDICEPSWTFVLNRASYWGNVISIDDDSISILNADLPEFKNWRLCSEAWTDFIIVNNRAFDIKMRTSADKIKFNGSRKNFETMLKSFYVQKVDIILNILSPRSFLQP